MQACGTKKDEHVGTVVAIEGDKAAVQLKADASCSRGFACACCSSLRPEPRIIRVVRADLEEGDTVRVLVPAYMGYLSMFVLFVLPLILVVVGFAIGGQFEEGKSAHGMATLVGGAVGFIVAVVVAAVVSRKLDNAYRYEVHRVRDAQF
jgi:positive regulator of sigma E activity